MLLMVAGFCVVQAWRIWSNTTLVLVPFQYTRDGVVVSQAGQDFTHLVNQDLQRLSLLFSRDAVGGTLIPSTDQLGRGRPLELPRLPESLLGDVEIQAYGVNVSSLVKTLGRWVQLPREIVGNVSERDKVVDVYAEQRGSGTGAEFKWYIPQKGPIGDASRELACSIYRAAAAKSDARFA